MFEGENRIIVVLTVIIALTSVTVYVTDMYWPRYENTFFELGLLGKNMKADTYFRNDDPSLYIGTPVTWYIYVHNHMGTEQDVIIKAKLLNHTMKLPDDKEHLPNSNTPIIEYHIPLMKDETVIVTFSWSVLDAELVYNYTTVEKLVYRGEDIFIEKEPLDATIIKSIIINGETHETSLVSYYDPNYWWVFELWVYDPNSATHVFGWTSKEGFDSASLRMSFRFHLRGLSP